MRNMLLSLILFSSSIFAAESLVGYHQIVCFNEINSKKIHIMIDGIFPDKYKNLASVRVSRNIDVYPLQVLISSTDNAKVEGMAFDLVDTSEQYIKNIKLDMGRSGKLSIISESVYGASMIQSTLHKFYLPTASKLQCIYSFINGPRPISGGN